MSNPFSYAGKRVVVTRAASGVGAALLDLLADIGVPDVTVLDLKRQPAIGRDALLAKKTV